jgi:hypothetical protein
MSNHKRQLSRALKDSTRFHISDETRAAHMRAISEAVASAPTPTVGRVRSSLRRRVGGIALVGAILAGPTGVALAAQGSLPGSSLYSVKRAVEHIQSVFDSSTPAKHRLDELSRLIATSDDQSKISEAFGEAETAVAAAPDSTELSSILDELRQKATEEGTTAETSDSTETSEPVVEPADGSDGSEVTGSQEPPTDETSDAPSETTVTESDGSGESSGDHGDSSDTGSTDDSEQHSDSEG